VCNIVPMCAKVATDVTLTLIDDDKWCDDVLMMKSLSIIIDGSPWILTMVHRDDNVTTALPGRVITTANYTKSVRSVNSSRAVDRQAMQPASRRSVGRVGQCLPYAI
jgi:hypothetical protein